MKTFNSCDVCIIGAGIVGLTTACMLLKQGFSVAIVDASELEKESDLGELDPRVSAINAASWEVLQELLTSEQLSSNHYCTLERIVAWDSHGGAEISFDAAEVNQSQLGLVVENQILVQALLSSVKKFSQAKLFLGERPHQLCIEADGARVMLESEEIDCQCVVGADGVFSWTRQMVQAKTLERSYGHHAIIGVVEAEADHQHTAYQNFLPTGPIGLLPLHHKRHHGFVWSLKSDLVSDMLNRPEAELSDEISQALDWRLGDLKLKTSLKSIPLTMRHAEHYAYFRVALVGDAAHSMHPLAGQGVNLGLMDAVSLANAMIDARESHRDIGLLSVLRRYERRRRLDNQVMMGLMRMFLEVFSNENAAWSFVRQYGLSLSQNTPWMKRRFIRYAMGYRGEASLRKLNE